MGRAAPNVLLLTGAPGIGKTTAIRGVARSLHGWRLGGFVTEEIRAHGVRQGFELVTFDGHRAVLAHVDHPGRPRVGKYGVDAVVLQTIATSALAIDEAIDVYLVDEIGKMECLSQAFVAAMRAVLAGRAPVVATIGRHGDGFIAEVKRRPDVMLWQLTRENRDAIPARVLAWLETRRTAASGRRRTVPSDRRLGGAHPRRAGGTARR